MNKRNRSGKRRGRFQTCKYCYNKPKRHQGICAECAKRTKEENKLRLRILLGYETLSGFLIQSNISKNNIQTIQSLLEIENPAFHEFASIMFEISQVHPYKKRRIKRIRESHPDLYQRMRRNGTFDWYFDEYDGPYFHDEQDMEFEEPVFNRGVNEEFF